MKEKKQNEEIQSRREFFKEAAKKALPVIGAIALASSPIIAQTANRTDPMGCTGTCYGMCVGSCKGCEYTCSGTCKNGCTGCRYTCSGTCKNGCMGVSR